ncbi:MULTISPECIES: winged helix-turn-helix domain-containing protein [unclassified Natrinema]|uniref:helix-turn-helix transcriptional regulator n=1 Tax=unclassified Natrinema TaxID=2622230 RepID=UPI00026D49D6|nr:MULTISPECIES: transcriptional regulator [unclassified Natrinema]AFO58532.1 transcriptional regulator [Natrinema sp. J7-2]
MGSSIEDIEFLARSEHRAGVLQALAERPCDRNALQETTGASSPTIGRILGDFEDRRWATRDGSTYELTPLGEFVAKRFGDLRNAMETERTLRDVWQWLPREMDGFTVDLFADAVVSYPGPEYPYQPVDRVKKLIEETTTMHGFGTTIFKSINNETVCRAVLNGMDFEYIYSPEVLEATVAWNPERVAEATACENCTILLHDDLPDRDRCGLGIFDDRIGICCHDARTGMLEAVIDTDAPEAREWAVSVFERHRADARPVSADKKVELFPSELVA